MRASAGRNRDLIWGLAFVVVALGLRFLYLPHIQALPTFDHPVMDAAYHDAWARRVASGSLSDGEPFFRAPLYPYALGLLYRLTGGSYLCPRLLQFGLGALTVFLTYLLARRLLGRLAAVVAGAAAAVYPVLIYFEGELLTETLFTSLLMLSLYLLDLAQERQAGRIWLLAGLSLGAALITRPTAAVFIPFAALGALFAGRRRLAHAALVLAGTGIMLAPVTAHNLAVSGEFIPLVWQGGLNFYLGNNPAASGWSATSPELRKDWWGGYSDMLAIPRSELAREPGYREVSDYWARKGLEFISSDPAACARLTAKKTALFWGSYEFPNNLDYNFMKLHSWVLRNPVVGFATVAPLALLGLVVLAPAARRLYFPYAFLLSFFAGTVAFFVCARYRAPALPVMMIFAGGAAAYIVDAARKRRTASLAAALALVAAAAAAVNLNLAGEVLPGPAQSYTVLANVYREQGDLEQAGDYYRMSVADNPLWGEGYEGLGIIAMERGSPDEAEQYLRKAVAVEPSRATAYRSLAMLYVSAGRLAEARDAVEEALTHAPYMEDNHNILGAIERQEGNTAAAAELFEREIELNPENWRAHANLASLLAEAGDDERAAEAYRRAIELNPGEPDLIFALATLYAGSGREDLAQELIGRLGESHPENPTLKYNKAVMLQSNGRTDEAGALYEEILDAYAYHEGALVNLGVIYAREGRHEEALALWLRALEVNPSNANARRNIELLREGEETGG